MFRIRCSGPLTTSFMVRFYENWTFFFRTGFLYGFQMVYVKILICDIMRAQILQKFYLQKISLICQCKAKEIEKLVEKVHLVVVPNFVLTWVCWLKSDKITSSVLSRFTKLLMTLSSPIKDSSFSSAKMFVNKKQRHTTKNFNIVG